MVFGVTASRLERRRPRVPPRLSTVQTKSPHNLTERDKQHTTRKLPVQCLREAQTLKGQNREGRCYVMPWW